MKFKLTTQLPKPKVVGIGELNIDRDGTAHFFIQNNLVADMVRVRLEWIAVKGIFLNGMEPAGYDRSGRPKFRYQEWFCAYIEEET